MIKSKYIDAISKSKVSAGKIEKSESGLQRKKTLMGNQADTYDPMKGRVSVKRSGTIK